MAPGAGGGGGGAGWGGGCKAMGDYIWEHFFDWADEADISPLAGLDPSAVNFPSIDPSTAFGPKGGEMSGKTSPQEPLQSSQQMQNQIDSGKQQYQASDVVVNPKDSTDVYTKVNDNTYKNKKGETIDKNKAEEWRRQRKYGGDEKFEEDVKQGKLPLTPAIEEAIRLEREANEMIHKLADLSEECSCKRCGDEFPCTAYLPTKRGCTNPCSCACCQPPHPEALCPCEVAGYSEDPTALGDQHLGEGGGDTGKGDYVTDKSEALRAAARALKSSNALESLLKQARDCLNSGGELLDYTSAFQLHQGDPKLFNPRSHVTRFYITR